MKYRAKCTHCISQMANIYDTRKNPIVKDAENMYIEVDTDLEAAHIETIDYFMYRANQFLNILEETIEKNR